MLCLDDDGYWKLTFYPLLYTLLTFQVKNYDCGHLNIEKLTSLEISQNHWANEANPTLDCSIEIVIYYIYLYM